MNKLPAAYKDEVMGILKEKADRAKHPCPCCGYITVNDPGGYDICPICFWEDDGVQLAWPLMLGGPNNVSLVTGQQNYARFGACEQRFLEYVRKPTEFDRRAPQWRPFDPTRDLAERPSPLRYESYEELYYWRKPD